MSNKNINWPAFAEQQKMNLDEQFWGFWRYFFYGNKEETRKKNWKAKDKDFVKHCQQLKELVSLATKKYE